MHQLLDLAGYLTMNENTFRRMGLIILVQSFKSFLKKTGEEILMRT